MLMENIHPYNSKDIHLALVIITTSKLLSIMTLRFSIIVFVSRHLVFDSKIRITTLDCMLPLFHQIQDFQACS